MVLNVCTMNVNITMSYTPVCDCEVNARVDVAGIVLSWNMTADNVTIASYQLWAYQETSAPPSYTLWKKVRNPCRMYESGSTSLTRICLRHFVNKTY